MAISRLAWKVEQAAITKKIEKFVKGQPSEVQAFFNKYREYWNDYIKKISPYNYAAEKCGDTLNNWANGSQEIDLQDNETIGQRCWRLISQYFEKIQAEAHSIDVPPDIFNFVSDATLKGLKDDIEKANNVERVITRLFSAVLSGENMNSDVNKNYSYSFRSRNNLASDETRTKTIQANLLLAQNFRTPKKRLATRIA